MLPLLVVACGGNSAITGTPKGNPETIVRTGPPVAADRVWVLEVSGTSPSDTAVTFAARAGRTVVLLHGPPDRAIFGIVEFPADTTAARAGDSLHVTIKVMPGRYGMIISTPDLLTKGARGTFSYAIHFQAPSGAKSSYPTDAKLEQALAPAQFTADGRVQFLPGERVAADLIRFAIPTPGSYMLAVTK